MELNKYTIYGKYGDATKISLDDDEWLTFIKDIIVRKPLNLNTTKSVSKSDLEFIDTNYCIPLLSNTGFIKKFGADTKLISIVGKGKGDLYLRFWLSENGIHTTLNNVMNELFPSILPIEILSDFWNWWSQLPLEPQKVGGQLITKQYQEFGIGHLQAWIKQISNLDEPKHALDKYNFNLKFWMYAFELYLYWAADDIINNNDGKLFPKEMKEN